MEKVKSRENKKGILGCGDNKGIERESVRTQFHSFEMPDNWCHSRTDSDTLTASHSRGSFFLLEMLSLGEKSLVQGFKRLRMARSLAERNCQRGRRGERGHNAHGGPFFTIVGPLSLSLARSKLYIQSFSRERESIVSPSRAVYSNSV